MVVPPSFLCGWDCTVCVEGCAELGEVGGSSMSTRCGSRPFSPVQTWIRGWRAHKPGRACREGKA